MLAVAIARQDKKLCLRPPLFHGNGHSINVPDILVQF